jgi:hypothetical protein
MKYNFADLEKEALERGMRLERGAPERPHGMRSGFIVWTRRGTWVQVPTLREAAKSIRLGR